MTTTPSVKEIFVTPADVENNSPGYEEAFKLFLDPDAAIVAVDAVYDDGKAYVAVGFSKPELTALFLDVAVAATFALVLTILGESAGVAHRLLQASNSISFGDEPKSEPKRWSAEIKATDVNGLSFSKTVEIDEVEELHDIIEKGPEYGPGYTAEIKLSYAA